MVVGMSIVWLFVLLVLEADHGGGNRVEMIYLLENVAPDSAPVPAAAAFNTSQTHNPSPTSGGGVNVLAAILVTASSVMVFMAFRLSICRCSKSSSSSDGASNAEVEELEEIQTAELERLPGASAADEKQKKKQLSLRVDWIENFTALVEYRSLIQRPSDDSDHRCCSVCLCEFSSGSNSGDEVRLLPACNHFFHPDCIDLWLLSHMSCPVCRRSVIPSHSRKFGDGFGACSS